MIQNSPIWMPPERKKREPPPENIGVASPNSMVQNPPIWMPEWKTLKVKSKEGGVNGTIQ